MREVNLVSAIALVSVRQTEKTTTAPGDESGPAEQSRPDWRETIGQGHGDKN